MTKLAAAFMTLTALGAIVASTQQSRSESTNDQLIVPNERIGPAIIGMTPAQLYAALGDPSNSYRGADSYWYSWKQLELTVAVGFDDNRVWDVETQSSQYRTKGGLGAGSSDLAITANLGAPSRGENSHTGDIYLCYQGVRFTEGRSGNVERVEVKNTKFPSC